MAATYFGSDETLANHYEHEMDKKEGDRQLTTFYIVFPEHITSKHPFVEAMFEAIKQSVREDDYKGITSLIKMNICLSITLDNKFIQSVTLYELLKRLCEEATTSWRQCDFDHSSITDKFKVLNLHEYNEYRRRLYHHTRAELTGRTVAICTAFQNELSKKTYEGGVEAIVTPNSCCRYYDKYFRYECEDDDKNPTPNKRSCDGYDDDDDDDEAPTQPQSPLYDGDIIPENNIDDDSDEDDDSDDSDDDNEN